MRRSSSTPLRNRTSVVATTVKANFAPSTFPTGLCTIERHSSLLTTVFTCPSVKSAIPGTAALYLGVLRSVCLGVHERRVKRTRRCDQKAILGGV